MSVENDPEGKVILTATNDGSARTGFTVPYDKEGGRGYDVIGGVSVLGTGEAREFEAWGTVEVEDKKKEIVEIEPLKAKLRLLAERGAGGAPLLFEHSHHVVGVVPEQKPAIYTMIDGRKVPAVYLRGRVFNHYRIDNEVWEKVKSGELNSISIGGRNYKERQMCNSQGECATVLSDLEPTEWSLTAIPAQPLAKITEVIKSEGEDGVVLLNARVRKPVLDHYREFGVDGKCIPCLEVVRDIGKSINTGGVGGEDVEGKVLDITKSMLDKALTRYNEWYGGAEHGEIPMNDEDKKVVQDIVKAEMGSLSEDVKKSLNQFKDDLTKEISKSVITSTDTSKGEVMGSGSGTPKDESKSLLYSDEYQNTVKETVKAEVEKAASDILKSLSNQVQEMVALSVKDVSKAGKGDEKGNVGSATPSPASGDVRKSGADIEAAGGTADPDPFTNEIKNAWSTGDISGVSRYLNK